MSQNFQNFKETILQTLESLDKTLRNTEKVSELEKKYSKIFQNLHPVTGIFKKNSLFIDDLVMPAISKCEISEDSSIKILKWSLSLFPSFSITIESFDYLASLNSSKSQIPVTLDFSISEKLRRLSFNHLLKFKSLSEKKPSNTIPNLSLGSSRSARLKLNLSIDLRLSRFEPSALNEIKNHLELLKRL